MELLGGELERRVREGEGRGRERREAYRDDLCLFKGAEFLSADANAIGPSIIRRTAGQPARKLARKRSGDSWHLLSSPTLVQDKLVIYYLPARNLGVYHVN